METKVPTQEEYSNLITDNVRRSLYNVTVLSSALYSIWYDVHTNIRETNLLINKNLIKNYKRLEKLCKSMSDCLQHLCPIENSSDETQDQHLALTDIYESYLKSMLNLLAVFPINTEHLNEFIELYDKMEELNENKVIEYNKPDWETFFKTLNLQPEDE